MWDLNLITEIIGTRETRGGGEQAVVGDHYTYAGSTVTVIIIMGILHKYIPSRHVVDDEGFLGGEGGGYKFSNRRLPRYACGHTYHVQPNLGEIVLHVHVHDVHVHACVLHKTIPYYILYTCALISLHNYGCWTIGELSSKSCLRYNARRGTGSHM